MTRIGNDGWFYNFWRDENHVQGIWRRTTLESYRSAAPVWETVIDVDALPPPTTGTASTWVWHGASPLDEGPDGAWDRVLVSLSPGGSDADTCREFDLSAGDWCDPATGFALSEPAKTRAGYRSRQELLVGTDFGGDGSTLTDSGYPRVVKSWRRGTPLAEAVTVFEGEQADISADQWAYHDRGAVHEFQRRSMTFYTSKLWHRTPTDLRRLTAAEDPAPFVEVPIPEDAELSTFGDAALVEVRARGAQSLPRWQAPRFFSGRVASRFCRPVSPTRSDL